MKTDALADLQFHTPPKNTGQIVTVSYAYDGQGGIWQRRYDASDRTDEYTLYADPLWTSVEENHDPWSDIPILGPVVKRI